MGRRNLSRLVAVVALFLTLAPSAGAAIRWQLLADGAASGSSVSTTTAFVALSRSGANAQFSSRLTDRAESVLGRADFSRHVVVAIFGEFGCRDHRIAVTSIVRHGSRLAIGLTERRPRPGTVECMAIYQTYRLLSVPRASLARPYPTRAVVSLARA